MRQKNSSNYRITVQYLPITIYTYLISIYLSIYVFFFIQGVHLILCFFRSFKNISDSGLSLFSLGVSVCTLARQVGHQHCSRSGRVQKNHKILRKKHNFNEHPVSSAINCQATHVSQFFFYLFFLF